MLSVSVAIKQKRFSFSMIPGLGSSPVMWCQAPDAPSLSKISQPTTCGLLLFDWQKRFALWFPSKVKIKPAPHEIFYIIKCTKATTTMKNVENVSSPFIAWFCVQPKDFYAHLLKRSQFVSNERLDQKKKRIAVGRWGEREVRAKKERNNVQFILVN